MLIETIYKIMEHRDIALGNYKRDDGKRYRSIMVQDLEYVFDQPLETDPMENQDEVLQQIERRIPTPDNK